MNGLWVTTLLARARRYGTRYGPGRWLIVLRVIASPSVGYAPWSRVNVVSIPTISPSALTPIRA